MCRVNRPISYSYTFPTLKSHTSFGKIVFVKRHEYFISKCFLHFRIRSSHRDYFRKHLFFSSRSTFSGVFQEGLSVHRTDKSFPGGCGLFTEQTPFFQEPSLCVHRTDTNFPGALSWLPNRYRFSRKATLKIIEQIGNFQEGTPLRTDISEIGHGGCFRIYL